MAQAHLPHGWSVAMNPRLDQTGVYHLHVDKGRRYENSVILDRACGYSGTLSGLSEKEVETNRRCRNCVRGAVKMFREIDGWTAEQCDNAMRRLNSETRHLEEIANNLEYYREHCRYLVRDHAGLTNEDLA